MAHPPGRVAYAPWHFLYFFPEPRPRSGTCSLATDVADPFLIIVAILALATVVLWPIRAWMASRRIRDHEPDS